MNKPKIPVVLDDTNLVNSYGYAQASNTGNREYLNWLTNISVRSDFARSDYEYFRPGEQIPKKGTPLINFCMEVYNRVGVVYHVINLMSDFASNGIELVHPVKSQERFYQKWFEKVNGKERSSAILNMVLRAGSAVIQRSDGNITIQDSNDWKKAGAAKTSKARQIPIPLKYTIHNPVSLEVLGGEVSNFLSKPYFLLKVGSDIVNGIDSLKRNPFRVPDEVLKSLINEIPKILSNPANRQSGYIQLDQSKLYPIHYKKDDGDTWAKPLVTSVLEDIVQLTKMKLADVAALDGVISNIRLWNLGIYNQTNPTNSILPTRGAIEKLRNILATSNGGGVLDLVWGPELSFTESNTNTHQFLGETKYKPIWHNIYEGLGIPPTLTSTGGGMTNNVLALKTFIERLEYLRNLLITFWNEQVKIVQKQMGFSKPAKVSFPEMSLSDDATIKKLLIDLVDRDIISGEAVQKAFGFIPESQNAQVMRETKKRKAKKSPPKASQFHNPNTENEMKKIVLQGGGVTPSEVGLELSPKKPGEKSQIEKQGSQPQTVYNPKKSNNGRPKNSTDQNPRKKKVVTPRKAFIDKFIQIESTQAKIAEIVTPIITSSLGKKNIRQLSNDETKALEEIKFAVLCNADITKDITDEYVYSLIEKSTPEWGLRGLAELKQEFVNSNHRQPNIEELRKLQSSARLLYG